MNMAKQILYIHCEKGGSGVSRSIDFYEWN